MTDRAGVATNASTGAPTRAPRRTSYDDADPVMDFFASDTLAEHLLRGAVGLALVVAGLVLAGDHPWALLGLPLAVLAWRGCPTCWTLGLAQTMTRGRVGGACPLPEDRAPR